MKSSMFRGFGNAATIAAIEKDFLDRIIDKTTGTGEWCGKEKNTCKGCPRDCRYCYARLMALRFKRCTWATWKDMQLVKENYVFRPRHVDKVIMFPSTHDVVIKEPFFTTCMDFITAQLAVRNKVLWVTKPDRLVIERATDIIASRFDKQVIQDFLDVRLTITNTDESTREFWEPNASTFADRLKSLDILSQKCFTVSVSIEPCLDKSPDKILCAVLVHERVKEIWLGTVNPVWVPFIRSNFRKEGIDVSRLDKLLTYYEPDVLRYWLENARDERVFLKDSLVRRIKSNAT